MERIIQKLILNGVNIGTIKPGEFKAFNDFPGEDRILIFYIHGTNSLAWTPASVHIQKCGSSNIIS